MKKQGRHPANSCEKSWNLLNLLEFAISEKRVTDGQGLLLSCFSQTGKQVTPFIELRIITKDLQKLINEPVGGRGDASRGGRGLIVRLDEGVEAASKPILRLQQETRMRGSSSSSSGRLHHVIVTWIVFSKRHWKHLRFRHRPWFLFSNRVNSSSQICSFDHPSS